MRFCCPPLLSNFKIFVMSDSKMSPDGVKLVWKIIVYVVTALASFFGGNAAAQVLNVHFFQ